MSDETSHPDYDARRRRLDDLFADEPHLSATMKARRLHEKLRAMDAQQQDTPQDLPTEAFVVTMPPHSSASQGPLSSGTLFGPGPHCSLAEAAHCLQTGERDAELSPATASRLRRLRDGILSEWLAALPRQDGR